MERKPKCIPVFIKLLEVRKVQKWFSKNVSYKQRVNRDNEVKIDNKGTLKLIIENKRRC